MSAGAPPKRPIQKVAQGSYGCVYRPAFRCAGEPNIDEAFAATRNGKVSKLLSRNEARQELEHAAVVRAVDPNQQYIVYAEKSCDIHPENVEKYKAEFNACTAKHAPKPNSPNAVHLYMPDAGRSLGDITIATIEYNDVLPLFKSFLNLFDGLIELHKNDFVHMDIAERNIVAKRNPDGTWTTRFIDLGWSIHLPQYFKKVLDPSERLHLKDGNVETWPPYIKFAAGEFYDASAITVELLKEIDKLINDPTGAYRTTIVPKVKAAAPAGWAPSMPLPIGSYEREWTLPNVSVWLDEFRRKSESEKISTPLTEDIPIFYFIKDILCCSDIYALGMVLFSKFKELIVVRTDPDDGKTILSVLPENITEPDDIDSYETRLYHNLSKKYEMMINNMMYDTNGFKDASIILRNQRMMFFELLSRFEEYLEDERFQTLFKYMKGPLPSGGARIKLTRRRRGATKPRKTRKTRGTRRR